jgi:hypothetical protein
VVRKGGTLHDPRGNNLAYYAWGLGMVLNNIVEAYALYEGVCIENERKILRIMVFRDSIMVVRAIHKRIQRYNNIFNGVISFILYLIDGFHDFIIFHIKDNSTP